jgi:hypothetical protein
VLIFDLEPRCSYRLGSAQESRVRQEIVIIEAGMNNVRIDDGSSFSIAASIHFLLVDGEEPEK